MFYNNEKKFIFIHLPKTGGTFLSGQLRMIPNTHDNVFSPHNGIKEPDWHFGLKETEKYLTSPLNEYTVFSVIRNPFDWYVSLYEYTKKGNFHEYRLFKEREEGETFKNWLFNIVTCRYDKNIHQEFKNDHTSTSTYFKLINKLNPDIGWLTYRYLLTFCMDFTYFNNDEDIITYMDKNSKLDFTLHQERLNQDLASLFHNNLKLPDSYVQSALGAPKSNVTQGRKSYHEYYDQESIDLVTEKEKYLLEKFNYKF